MLIIVITKSDGPRVVIRTLYCPPVPPVVHHRGRNTYNDIIMTVIGYNII